MAYLAGLTYPEPLAGIIALSTYIPSAGLLEAGISQVNRQIPLFVAHGTSDDVVSLKLGSDARETLEQFGYAPEWHTYRMPHSVCAEEVRDIGDWLNGRLVSAGK